MARGDDIRVEAGAALSPLGTRPRLAGESRRFVLYAQLLLLDVTSLLLGVTLATLTLGQFGDLRLGYIPFLVVTALYVFAAVNNGSYSTEALRHRAHSIRQSLSALVSALLLMFVIEFLLKNVSDMSRMSFVIGAVTGGVLLILGRLLTSAYITRMTHGRLVDELVIVDGKPDARWQHVAAVESADRLHIQPDLNDPAMLGRFGQVASAYDVILIDSVPERRHAWALMLKGAHVNGEILTDDYSRLGAVGIRNFHGRESLLVARRPLSMRNRMRKRLFDLALTIPILIFLCPMLLAVAIAVKLESKGPVLFKQDRIGRGNRLFKVIKFRSMRVEGSDYKGARSTERNDARITRVGKFIRATSIDELPQLFNVLMGDMSLVGPRPHPLGSLAEGKLFWHIDETYWHRHQLKPGITGLAQVRGFRGATHEMSDLTNRLQADMEYIEGWGIWRDITILANTLRVVVHHNAF